MPRLPKTQPKVNKDTVQVTFRVPRGWLDELDACARALPTFSDMLEVFAAANGFTRTDALRVCLRRGIDSVLKDSAND